MPSVSAASTAELPGDRARRHAAISLLIFALGLPLSYLLFSRLQPIWDFILPLEGPLFLLAATTLGLSLAATPVATAAGFILAIWFGVDSIYCPHSRSSGLLDRLIIAVALLVWFSPALFAIASAIHALLVGHVHFVRPPRDYYLATDPIAFWQGIGFWFIMASLFAFLAWRYWRPRLFPRTAEQV